MLRIVIEPDSEVLAAVVVVQQLKVGSPPEFAAGTAGCDADCGCCCRNPPERAYVLNPVRICH